MITPSSSYVLQYDGIPRLILRSITFLKKSSRSLNQRNGPRLSSSTSIPSTGIVTDLNPLRQPLSTRSVPVNVSPSTLTFSWIVFIANLPVYFFRDGRSKKKGSYKTSGCEEKKRPTRVPWGRVQESHLPKRSRRFPRRPCT